MATIKTGKGSERQMGRVLVVSFQLSGYGGVENVLASFAHELGNRGQSVVIALMGPSRSDRRWEQNLSNLEVGPGTGPLKRFYWFRSLVRKLKPDLVIVLSPIGAVMAALNRTFIHDTYRIASWIHTAPEFYGSNLHMLRLCDVHMGICPTMTRQLEAFTCKPAITVWNPVQAVRSIVPRSTSGISLIFIGRLDKIKRVDRILTALARVSGPWELTIIGDGPERNYLEQMAINLGIQENITWTGWLSDPWAALKQADVGLLTSDYEGFSLSVAEFLCHGIPVAAMDCECGPRDLINPEVNGWLVPPGDVEELTSLIQGLTDGLRRIPEPLSVQESVKHLSTKDVVSNFINAIDAIIDGKQKYGRFKHVTGVVSAFCRWGISKL